jgi:hypothetical protein
MATDLLDSPSRNVSQILCPEDVAATTLKYSRPDVHIGSFSHALARRAAMGPRRKSACQSLSDYFADAACSAGLPKTLRQPSLRLVARFNQFART